MDSLRAAANRVHTVKLGYIAIGITTSVVLVKLASSLKRYISQNKVKGKAIDFARKNDIKVCIIGSGISGICTAIKLKEKNINFEVFEMSHDIGGTWLDNNYPAAGCDVQAYIYNYSFFLGFPWSSVLVRRDEIMKYLHATVEKFKIRHDINFSHKILSCQYDEATKMWQVTYQKFPTSTTKLEMETMCESSLETFTKTFNFVISATGQLNQPRIPKIQGLESFKGVQFHTSRWNHNISLSGKNVLAIGSGPSAIQAFPEVYKSCKNFYLLYRSGTYFVTRAWLEKRYSNFYLTARRILPFFLRLRYLFGIYLADLNFHLLFTRRANEEQMTKIQSMVRDHALKAMSAALKPSYETYLEVNERKKGEDKDTDRREEYESYMKDRADRLVEELTPHILPGCKRLAFSSKWFQMFTAPNVTLLKRNIKEIHPSSVTVTPLEATAAIADELVEDIDVIIWATGFNATQMAEHIPFTVKKTSGEVISLNEKWSVTPRAYKGCCVDDFPNLFIIYGPNTNLGHNSITYMVECSVNYVTSLIQKTLSLEKTSIQVKSSVFEDYNNMIQHELKKTVFTANCNNWYKDALGNSPTNWPKSVHAFNVMTRNIDINSYILS